MVEQVELTTEEKAAQERIRSNIYNKVYAATETAVDEKIEAEKDAIRQGDGSFFGWLKSIVFAIAEFFSVEGWLANLVGTPIPEQGERTALSGHIANTVSKSLTDKTFEFSNKQEFETKLRSRIENSLATDAASMPSFSPDQLKLAAAQAATGALNEFADLFDEKGNVKVDSRALYLSPVNMKARTQFLEAWNDAQDKNPKLAKSLATLADKPEMEKNDLDIIATVLAPTLSGLHEDSKLSQLKGQGESAFATVTDEVRGKLLASRDTINKAAGTNFDEAGLAILADEIAKGFVHSAVDKKLEPSQDFTVASETRKQAAINSRLEKKVATLVTNNIRTNTAVGVLANYKDSFFTSPFYPNEVFKVDEYYSHANEGKWATDYYPNDKPRDKDLADAEEKLNKFAAGENSGLNKTQREAVSKIIAKTVRDTLNEPGARALADDMDKSKEQTGKDRKELAEKLKQNIYDALNSNKEELGKLKDDKEDADNKIETINKKLKIDLFDKLAEGIAKNVTENKDGTYTQLAETQNLLVESRQAMIDKNELQVATAGAQELVSGGVNGQTQAQGGPRAGGSKGRR